MPYGYDQMLSEQLNQWHAEQEAFEAENNRCDECGDTVLCDCPMRGVKLCVNCLDEDCCYDCVEDKCPGKAHFVKLNQ